MDHELAGIEQYREDDYYDRMRERLGEEAKRDAAGDDDEEEEDE